MLLPVCLPQLLLLDRKFCNWGEGFRDISEIADGHWGTWSAEPLHKAFSNDHTIGDISMGMYARHS